MPQLVFHGKKTVPSGIKRDSWRPYFSVHFPQTDNGKRLGLSTYRRLREFSMRRQLDPSSGYLIVKQEDLDAEVGRKGDPLSLKQKHEENILWIRGVGERMNLWQRQRKLMNQKATAVADVAFALELVMEKLKSGADFDAAESLSTKTAEQLANRGRRAQRTLKHKRSLEAQKAAELEQRSDLVDGESYREGNLRMDKFTAAMVALEHDGAVVAREDRKVVDMLEIPDRQLSDTYQTGTGVQILWADLRDGTFAPKWPEDVFHGELQPMALHKKLVTRNIVNEFEDDDEVGRQQQEAFVISGRNIHVHGRQLFRTSDNPSGMPKGPFDEERSLGWNEREVQRKEMQHFRKLVKEIEALTRPTPLRLFKSDSATAQNSQEAAISSNAASLLMADKAADEAAEEPTSSNETSLKAIEAADPDGYTVASEFVAQHRQKNAEVAAIRAAKVEAAAARRERAKLQRLGADKSDGTMESRKDDGSDTIVQVDSEEGKQGENEVETVQKKRRWETESEAVQRLMQLRERRRRGGALVYEGEPYDSDLSSEASPSTGSSGVVVPQSRGFMATVKGWLGRS
jgi:hypothetical protein